MPRANRTLPAPGAGNDMKRALFGYNFGISNSWSASYGWGHPSTFFSLPMTRRFYSAALLALFLGSSRLAAQQPSTGFEKPVTPMVRWNEKDVPLRENLLSVNPLGVVFEYFSAEFEHSTTRATSLAVSGSYMSPFDITYTSFDVIGRYYPAEQGLRGFAIGPTVGYTQVKDKNTFACWDVCTPATTTHATTVGVQIDYSWILGPSQHFGIELGLGAKRLFYSGSSGGGSEALPTGRVSVGYSF